MTARRIGFYGLWAISLLGLLYTGIPLYYYIFFMFVIVFLLSLVQMILSVLSFNMRTSLSLPVVGKKEDFVWELVPRAIHLPVANARISVAIPDISEKRPLPHTFYVSPSYKKASPVYVHITPLYSGKFPLRVIRIEFTDFLGLWYISFDADRFILDNPIYITVLPDTSSFMYSSLLYDEIMLPVRRTRDRAESVGVREYEPGDNMRSIHWKYTARVGKLHVKEYEKGAKDLHLIYVDLTAPVVSGEDALVAIDRMLCGVASLSHFLLREQVPLMILCYGEESDKRFDLLHANRMDAARLFLSKLEFVNEIPHEYKEKIANFVLAEKATLTVFSMSVSTGPLSFLTYRAGDYSTVSLCIVPQPGFEREQQNLANLFTDKGIHTLLLPSLPKSRKENEG